MIKLFTFHPEHFDNNGDQGNIEVLRFELERAGVKHGKSKTVEAAEFVLIGDASRAAMRHYAEELRGLLPSVRNRMSAGHPTLLAGSSYEFFASELGLTAEKMPRKSEFVSGEYFGYRNTELDLPIVHRKGLFVATSLFGPFLAKNPSYLSDLLRGLGVQSELDPVKLEWIEKIREISAG
ncbi:MAG: hypothetical protein DCO81_02210 [Candidatus Aquiluna sp. XM-24bin5]|nr:MAG: hypothetical protein DCO81_02210 [Candidatus Aquiluna sp. XM-24bin5]